MANNNIENRGKQLGLPGMGGTPAEKPKTRGQGNGQEKRNPWAPPKNGWSWQRKAVVNTYNPGGEIEVDGKTRAAGGND